jgi:uncharacterized LabA/DUF88 family protein
MRTAFLVDGAFFLIRYRRLKGNDLPSNVARRLYAGCMQHLRKLGREKHHLYRIFYYDCPPIAKKLHNPISKKAVDFSKSDTARWRRDFFDELRRMRKVALRLGYLDEGNGHWTLKWDALKKLTKGEIAVSDLTPEDVKYEVRQKGVDMKLGLDIASLAYKKLVDQIVLVSGDSDFVAAAKLARREGIDFVLDPMWHQIRDDLHEHIDGLQSVFRRRAIPPVTPPVIPPPENIGNKEPSSGIDAASIAATPSGKSAKFGEGIDF